MQVFADHQQWVRASGVGEERQGRDAGEEGRRQVAGPYAERDIERIALRLGQLGDVVAQRPQQQVQPGVRRRGFVGSSGGAEHPYCALPCAPLELVDQGGLPDAGVALDEQCRPAGVEFGGSGIEQREFGVTADEGAVWLHVSILAHPRGRRIHRRIHGNTTCRKRRIHTF